MGAGLGGRTTVTRSTVLMKTKLIVNPASGQETAIGHLPAINARLREAGAVDIVLTTGEGDGIEAGRRAAAEGYDRVFVAGGDGTLNEVLNGIAQVEGALATCPTPVPRQPRVPHGHRRARGAGGGRRGAARRRSGARRRRPRQRRSFLNISAGGFIADVSDGVNPQLKTVLGKLAYLVGGRRCCSTTSPRRPHHQRLDDDRGLAAGVRGVQLTADRRRPPDCAARHRRRRLAGRLPDWRHAGAGVRGAAAAGVERRPRRRRSRHLFPYPGAGARFDRAIRINTDGQVLEAGGAATRCCPARRAC